MAKIVLVNAYELDYLGTRVLATHLRKCGHKTHNILLNSGEYITLEEPLDNHEGYQSVTGGILSVNCATIYKVGKEDLDLLELVLHEETPDIIGFSARSTNNWLIPLLVPVFCSAAPNALLVAGGFGPTLEPELYLQGGFDVVVRCDGEEALAALAHRVDAKPFATYLNYDWVLSRKDLFGLILDAGFAATGVGFQTGSKEFAKEQYNRILNVDYLVEYTKLLFKNNVRCGIHLIGGNCYETEEVLQETIDLVRRLPFALEAPYFIGLENIRLRPHPKTPITIMHPRVVTDPMPAKEWYYRALLLEFARILDVEAFEELRRHGAWRENVVALARHYKEVLAAKQLDHFKGLVENLRGKPHVFYGVDGAYKANKQFFNDLSPMAILLDTPKDTTSHIDGIPVMEPEQFIHAYGKDIPILLFLDSFLPARRKLTRELHVPNENIHSCPQASCFGS